MTYAVKEIFWTLQGEGAHAGRPAVFCRFAGCNLWTGREADRDRAICRFCDTDFIGTNGSGGGKFATSKDLATAIAAAWPQNSSIPADRFVVCTGGEPLLQLDADLIRALHKFGFEVAVETNGTLPAPPELDWICVSPKANTRLAQRTGDELKLVFPQAESEAHPTQFEGLGFRYFYLQPMDGPSLEQNTRLSVQYCLEHPNWRLSLQSHKLLGIR